MPTLQTFIDQAWTDHADDAWGVSLRLPDALDRVTDADGMLALARLVNVQRWQTAGGAPIWLLRAPCAARKVATSRVRSKSSV